MAAARKQDQTSENYLGQLWFKYMPYWPLFLLFTLLSLGVAWYYLQHQTPLYSAVASILIKGEEDSKGVEDLNPIAEKNTIDNEIQTLKSRLIMTSVVRNLGLYAPVHEEKRFANHLAYQTSPVSVICKNPDEIRETEKIYFNFDVAAKTVSVNNVKYPLDKWVNTPYGVLKFIPNKNLTTATENKLYFSLYRPENYAWTFINQMDALTLNKNSDILYVTIKDENPRRGEDVLNEVLNVYIKNIVNGKNELAKNTLKFVEERLSSVSHELDSIERKIQQIKSNGAFDISSQGAMYLQNVNDADKKLGDVNSQLAVLNTVENYVLSKGSGGGIVPSSLGVNDPILSDLLAKLYTAELEYERLKKTTAENNPMLVSLMDQINKIRPNILENIQNQRKSLQANRNNLYATSGNFNAMLQRIPQKEKELLDVNREQNIKNNIYTFLLQKREEAALSTNSLATENKIIDKAAASPAPVSPNSKRTYIFSIILAFALCVSLIVGKEIFVRKILYRQEIENLTSFPVIGEIAFGKTKNLLITEIADGKETFIADHFRKLRTSLTFLGIDSKRKRILVTSSIPGEGKSFVVANLGLSLALAGKKVILLEFDLINPSLSKKLYVNEENGISNYLLGEMELDEIIKKSKVHENLFVIPSGPLTDNPSELLLNEKVEDMLNTLNENFDYIIIDTAPVGPVTDAYVLSPHCDATLYVVRHKYTPKVFMQRLDDESKINPLKNPAIVFNAVKNKGFMKNDYGYGYGYRYNYGYGNKDRSKRKKVTS